MLGALVLLAAGSSCGSAAQASTADGGGALVVQPAAAASHRPRPVRTRYSPRPTPVRSTTTAPRPTVTGVIPPTSTVPGWGAPVQVENFDGTALDQTRWRTYEDPGGYHPRRARNVRVGGGELQLVGVGDASGGIASRIEQRYGRWESRFRVDRGAGYAGVVLLWPQDEQWPQHGEIDLMEVPREDRVLGVSTVHHGADNRMAANRLNSDFTQWHTVAVDWLADHITFYLDGNAIYTVRQPTNGTFDYIPRESPMHITLQNDKGCDSFIQCPNAATPAQVVMHVDWVKIYRLP